MKNIFICFLLVIATQSQTTVTPKLQRCQCSDLKSQADCQAQNGCSWTNMTLDINSTIPQGTCANQTFTGGMTPSYCLNVLNFKICAQTIGCAFLNNTCQIFSGCSAYVQTKNEECQNISAQCTTDGQRCVQPAECQSYKSQFLCTGNIATSGSKSCNWISNQCVDKVCSDAPTTYTMQAQCTAWIAGCLATGKGCATSLGACSTYKQVNGCTGMIGYDGPCIADTSTGSTLCRPLVCLDAPYILQTNYACQAFLPGCLTKGKGCVSSLSDCSLYKQYLGCTGLIGSDGPCTVDTTAGSTTCRALACTDAPASTITNAGCQSFLAGCVTTGSGCTYSLGQCSSYKGTSITCSSFRGTDGNCKGTSTTVGSCSARICADAPIATYTNNECSAFQIGCVTTGAGCTARLGLCRFYKGTATTSCTQFIGIDGNCTEPSNQTNDAACTAKVCTDAPNTNETNAACSAYSYLCVTNRAGCIAQVACEVTTLAISCQGTSNCSQNKVCLNRSDCSNYQNQSQCLLNKQQYLSGGVLYLRSCTWSLGICQNQVCAALSGNLTTDEQCSIALAGCVTNGARCLDVSEPCTSYQGTYQQCNLFKGLYGTQRCGQIVGAISAHNCIARECSNAINGGMNTSDVNCNNWLTGCNFDGKDNCTAGDCTTYYGTQTYCGSITTAKSGGKFQKCWKLFENNSATSACVEKICSQAPSTLITNQDCNIFLAGCVTNGMGCVPPDTQCNQYTGNLNICKTFKQNGMACSKSAAFCKPLDCALKIPPKGTASNQLWCQAFVDQAGNNCQYDKGPACITAAVGACSKFVSSGSTDGDRALSCYKLNLDGTQNCGFETGGLSCSLSTCVQFILPNTAITGSQKAIFCKTLSTDSADPTKSCGLAFSTQTVCSARACTDFGIGAADDRSCANYLFGCKYAFGGYCYAQTVACDYKIPEEFATDIQKAQFCSAISTTDLKPCTYQAAISTTSCSTPAAACTNIFVAKVLASDSQKLQFCRASKMLDGRTCAYINYASTSCALIGTCATYPAIGTTDDEKQLSCAAQIETASQNCVYTSGEANCGSATLTNCATVSTLGATGAIKQVVCNAYTANSKKCGYALNSSASTCTDAACSDVAAPSLTSCPAYLSNCVYDGSICVTQDICTNYNAQTTGSGALINCQNLTDNSGNKCTYLSGKRCLARACTDPITNPSASNCEAYLSTCLFNGSQCIDTATECTSYHPQGANDSAKASICNSLSSTKPLKCTYITGSIRCANTMACTSYILPQDSQNAVHGQLACALAQDTAGNLCAYDPTLPLSCVNRTCAFAITANSDEDCNNWLFGCDQDSNSNCGLLSCSSNTSLIENCIEKTCIMNTTAKNDADCAAWYPPKTDGSPNCVWGGGLGCVPPQNCASFSGSIDSCSTFTATDGPCSGTTVDPKPCVSNNKNCTGAPTNFNTDKLCKSWGSSCMTTGFGCINQIGATCQSISSHSACSLYKSTPGLFCDLADQCKTKPIICSKFTFASECNNTPLAGQTTFTCAWDTIQGKCVNQTCAFLPLTLTTDSACSNIFPNCTTSGFGCITKGSCSSYPKFACNNAAATDSSKGCIWSKSICRPIQCTDNTIATSDAACNTYLEGCRTTGSGCSSIFSCSVFTSPQYCLSDSSKSPCLWYKSSANAKGACINYKQCTDIASSSHAECQAATPLCTTNGTNCIAITGCSKTVLQASCIVGTDGNCGWLPSDGTTSAACSLFTYCSAAMGTTTAQCLAWGPTCVSNGTRCIAKSTCSSYMNQIGCANGGYDGACFWVAPTGAGITGTCRVQVCSDATTNTLTLAGCAGFKAETPCTTTGTGCIPQSTCSSNKAEAGCIQGTDGICFWENIPESSDGLSLSSCRLKQCEDSLIPSSAQCAKVIKGVKCVSNGVYCIPQSTCSSYTAREACLGGGSDGACAFTSGTNATTPNVGTCAQFTQCSNANSDQTACNTRLDACYFNSTTTDGTTISSCQPHTCQTKALGSSCQPVPSWDLSTYQICVLTGTTCAAGNPASFTATTCYSNSVGTYSWSVNSSSCTVCISTTPNTTNNTANNTNNTYGYLFSLVLTIALLF